jgi:uncharacterized membrane protein
MDRPWRRPYRAAHGNTEILMRIALKLSLAKTASFAVLHFAVAFAVTYALTGNVGVAGAVALIEPLANTMAFFLHERAWSRITPRSATGETRLASTLK